MKKGLLALSPLAVFLIIYVVSSVIAGDFYAVPVSSSFLIACIWSVLIARGPLKERLAVFSAGAGHPDILTMIWIFLLAGVFAQTAKDIGAVDGTTALMLQIMPAGALYAGLFVTACLISTAVGTSIGTIAALIPIGSGIAAEAGLSQAFLAAVIVGGAFFGDNLSFISDTTIAATRAAGCEMREKFSANLRIVLPAFIAVSVLYAILGHDLSYPKPETQGEWIRILPYVLVIILSLMGRNVNFTLCTGILAGAVIGFALGDFTWISWLQAVGRGITGMSELVIVTLLSGGMLAMIRAGGGLDWIIRLLTRRIRSRTAAQGAIAGIVSLANVCTANNTIAIITSGGIASDIAGRFGIAPRKTASLLDTFSCFVQGLLPYGAQLLMAAGLCGVSPTAIIPHLYYPFLMGLCAILNILLDRKRP